MTSSADGCGAAWEGIGWIAGPAARLQHTGPIALCRQPQGRDTATEARPDHQDVVVEIIHRILSSLRP